MEFTSLGVAGGSGEAGRDGVDEDEVNEIENGMRIFDNGIGWRQGLRAILCCGDDARSKGSKVKPNS